METALLLPILLILLLGAIDFGRLFFGYANLHQAVRIGANFAATHAEMDADDRLRYEELIDGDLADLNCELDTPIPNPTYTTSDGTPVVDPELGDFATLTLDCDFSPITPLGDVFFGDPIAMSATSTFPIREGCVNCPTPAQATPPPTPLQCRLVPDLDRLSVAGARLAWHAAGFDPANFMTLPSTAEDFHTVESFTVTEDDPLSTCEFPTFAIFSSDVVATVTDPDTETPPTCVSVPNLLGTLVGDAQGTWVDADFTGELTADGGDPSSVAPDRVIVQQDTAPPSAVGVDCLDPAATVNVVTGDPLPEPPPLPCRVPNMINLKWDEGLAEWVDATFSVANYAPSSGNFKIGSQSLVGGTYVTCDASITVEPGGGGGGGGNRP
ncbi:MAG TPA: TadE/TadG family type IV pilus assembly protein [Microbacterium sp.]|nr:TadE/TadG family type IV pilus assembly protein [Microbacterium sp.]